VPSWLGCVEAGNFRAGRSGGVLPGFLCKIWAISCNQGGYSIPNDIDQVGRFDIEINTWLNPETNTETDYKVLVLRDMWLGSSVMAENRPPSCGHRFIPQHVYYAMRR
jgi:hypothetical protein